MDSIGEARATFFRIAMVEPWQELDGCTKALSFTFASGDPIGSILTAGCGGGSGGRDCSAGRVLFSPGDGAVSPCAEVAGAFAGKSPLPVNKFTATNAVIAKLKIATFCP